MACHTVGSPGLVELGAHGQAPGKLLQATESQLSLQAWALVWARTIALAEEEEEEKPSGKCSFVSLQLEEVAAG